MPDREKVIKEIKAKITYAETTDQIYSDAVRVRLLKDVLELLKEQEAVKPRISTAEQRCGHCNKVIEMDGWQSCPWCGKRIDWKGWWKKNGTRNQDT